MKILTPHLFSREILSEFFGGRHKLGLTSVASPIVLGTRDHIKITDPILASQIQKCRTGTELKEINRFSQSEFAIDGTENPHPRFPGLMKSIREHRGGKVEILIPIFQDIYTG